MHVQFPNFPVRNETTCKICSADIGSLAGIEYSYCDFVVLRSGILKHVLWAQAVNVGSIKLFVYFVFIL